VAQVIFDKVQLGKSGLIEMTPQLFKRHANLAKIDITANLRSEGLWQLALTVGRCAALTHFSLAQLDPVVNIDDGLVEVCVGLSMASSLEELKLITLGQSGGVSIQQKSSQALSTLLHWSVPNLRHLEVRAILRLGWRLLSNCKVSNCTVSVYRLSQRDRCAVRSHASST